MSKKRNRLKWASEKSEVELAQDKEVLLTPFQCKKVYSVETVQLFFDFLLEQTRLKKKRFWLGLLKITEIFREITSDYYAFIYVLHFFLMIAF